MHTVISAFDNSADAQAALDRLAEAGFARHDMHLEHRDAHGNIDMTPEQWQGQEREVAVDRGILASFGAFFTSILGVDDPSGHVDTYAQHVHEGNYVLVLDTHASDDAKRAADIVREMGSIDYHLVDRTHHHRPLRDILAARPRTNFEPRAERAVAAEPREELDKVGLRYADQDDKPR